MEVDTKIIISTVVTKVVSGVKDRNPFGSTQEKSNYLKIHTVVEKIYFVTF